MSKHTIGPWHVAENRHEYDIVIRAEGSNPVALCLIGGYTKPEGAANARLIAAAPGMLDILKRAAHVLAEVPMSSIEQIERFDALRVSVVEAIKQADPGYYGLPNHQGDEK